MVVPPLTHIVLIVFLAVIGVAYCVLYALGAKQLFTLSDITFKAPAIKPQYSAPTIYTLNYVSSLSSGVSGQDVVFAFVSDVDSTRLVTDVHNNVTNHLLMWNHTYLVSGVDINTPGFVMVSLSDMCSPYAIFTSFPFTCSGVGSISGNSQFAVIHALGYYA